jgi:hypothetical protein
MFLARYLIKIQTVFMAKETSEELRKRGKDVKKKEKEKEINVFEKREEYEKR